MFEQVRQDLLNILNESIKAIKENNIIRLRDLSNQTIHNSSIYQDENAITIAVLMYSLNKIFQRTSYRDYKDWKLFYDTVLQSLEKANNELKKNNIIDYQNEIKKILNVIDKLSSHLKKYIQEVFNDAQIAKGSRLYEHGISVGKTAELLGITEWEILPYVGRTGIYDMEENLSMKIEDRIKFTRGLFNIK